MPSTVFFSWQSDTPSRVGRSFLERALTAAIAQLAADSELEEAARDIELDRDTKNVAGSPPIVETIFGKIDAASAIVCDVTFVSERGGGKKSPNPNVLIEYGWALKSRSNSSVIAVMNDAYGKPSEVSLPFDMRHLRWPLTYSLPESASAEDKRVELKRLTERLVEALRPMILLAVEPKEDPVFKPRNQGTTLGLWEGADDGLGYFGSSTDKIHASQGPMMWFRMWPQFQQGRTWAQHELAQCLRAKEIVRPFVAPTGGFDHFRGDGISGVVTRGHDDGVGYWATGVFESGEIWGFDGYRLGANPGSIFFDPEEWTASISSFREALSALGITGPVNWEAGLAGCQGRRYGGGRAPSVKDVIKASGTLDGYSTREIVETISTAIANATN